MRTHIRGLVLRDDATATDAPLRVVAATEGRKPDGIDLRMSNVDLARFAANPIIGYGHDYLGRTSLPIGRATSTEVDGDRLLQEIEFDQGDEFAREVERKLRGGYLNAFSIGFEAYDISGDGIPARWELFENSVVPLPMDASALVESGRSRELSLLFDEVRAGKVLSAKNKNLLEDALAALAALLDAAAPVEEEPERDHSLEMAKRRLRLHQAA